MIQEHRNCQCEDRPACGCDNGVFEVESFPYPGDDTIEPDEDFGQDDEEADDHFEGGEDSYLDSSWEDRFEMDMGD